MKFEVAKKSNKRFIFWLIILILFLSITVSPWTLIVTIPLIFVIRDSK